MGCTSSKADTAAASTQQPPKLEAGPTVVEAPAAAVEAPANTVEAPATTVEAPVTALKSPEDATAAVPSLDAAEQPKTENPVTSTGAEDVAVEVAAAVVDTPADGPPAPAVTAPAVTETPMAAEVSEKAPDMPSNATETSEKAPEAMNAATEEVPKPSAEEPSANVGPAIPANDAMPHVSSSTLENAASSVTSAAQNAAQAAAAVVEGAVGAIVEGLTGGESAVETTATVGAPAPAEEENKEEVREQQVEQKKEDEQQKEEGEKKPEVEAATSETPAASSEPAEGVVAPTATPSAPWKVVVLGGGFGGLTVCKELDTFLSGEGNESRVQITLVEQNSEFKIGASNQFYLRNMQTAEDDPRSYEKLIFKHVHRIQGTIETLDTEGKRVVVREQLGAGDQEVVLYDELVISTGVQPEKAAVEGLEAASYDMCDKSEVLALREALNNITSGTVAIVVAEMPYKCPPAPYEYAFLVDGILREKGVRDNVKVILTTPGPDAVPEKNPKVFRSLLEEKNITFKTGMNPKAVTGTKKEGGSITFEDDSKEDFSILIAMVPHRGAKFLASCAALSPTPKNLIPADLMTLRTQVEGVYCIGDTAHLMLPLEKPKPHPKAGGFAVNQGRVVAENIIHGVQEPGQRNWGEEARAKQKYVAVCYAETGTNSGAAISVDLFSDPQQPSFEVSEPSAEGHQKKKEWVREMFNEWFQA